MLERNSELLGNRNRTAVLVAIRLLGETWASELSALLGLRIYSVQRIVEAYEREGVLVSRTMGRTRRVSLNPRYVAHRELDALLWKLGQHDVALQSMLAAGRRRPRRAGKPGLK
jgi:DNA-binding MarR family transcriptional regulator